MKKSILKQLAMLSAVIVGAHTMTGCEKQEKVQPKANAVASSVPAPVQDNSVYEAFRKSFEGFSYYPKQCVINGQKEVAVGFGIPVTEEQFVKLQSNFDGLGFKPEELAQFKHEVYQSVRKTGHLPEKSLDGSSLYRLTNGALRELGIAFVQHKEKTLLKPLAEKYGIHYDTLQPEVKAVMLNIDLATGGKLASYDLFLKAVARGDYAEMIAQCGVPERSYFKVYPDAAPNAAKNFNMSNRNALKVLSDRTIRLAYQYGQRGKE